MPFARQPLADHRLVALHPVEPDPHPLAAGALEEVEVPLHPVMAVVGLDVDVPGDRVRQRLGVVPLDDDVGIVRLLIARLGLGERVEHGLVGGGIGGLVWSRRRALRRGSANRIRGAGGSAKTLGRSGAGAGTQARGTGPGWEPASTRRRRPGRRAEEERPDEASALRFGVHSGCIPRGGRRSEAVGRRRGAV